MTVSAIKSIADEKGYVLTANVKADIIREFVTQQG